MRNFSKKLAFVLAAAMVFTAFAPAAKAEAAEDWALNRETATLYANEGVNDKGKVEGLTGNVQSYDFNFKSLPKNWKTEYTFKWTSDKEDVATVKAGGVVTAVAAGKAVIKCEIFDKVTTKPVDEVTATVTVKENADKVEISNAEDYEDFVVDADNREVDLNRVMFDKDGNKTSKRGDKVTDYTRWFVTFDGEDTKFVTINQNNGVYTFAADAPAGEYELYCETYQSDKYKQATATSEPVVVTVEEDKTFATVQKSTTSFDVVFNKPVKSLAVADVEVERVLKTSASGYTYPLIVKGVKLAEDKMSATVTVFNKFMDGTSYIVKVKGFEDTTMTASVGKPVRMEIVATNIDNGAVLNPSFLLTTGVKAALVPVYYDAADVDVSSEVKEKVRYTLDKTLSTKDCYLSGSTLTIKKNTASAVVVASYPGWIENGKRVGDFTATQEFCAEDAAPVLPVSVADYAIGGFQSWGAPKSIQEHETTKVFELKLQQSNYQNGHVVVKQGEEFPGDNKLEITITAMDPDVAVINSVTGVVTPHKTGSASFYVNYVYYDKDLKKDVTVPFDVITIDVTKKSYIDYTTVSAGNVKVGTHDDYHNGSVKVTAFDQYNQRIDLPAPNEANFKIECLSEGYGDQAALAACLGTEMLGASGALGWKNALQINIDSHTLRDVLVAADAMEDDENNGEFVDLEFKATYTINGSKKEVEFSVTIQEWSNKIDDNLIEIVASDAEKDVLRLNDGDQGGAKTVNFTVKWMNNDVQIGVQTVAKYDKDAATNGEYQFKVLKDGKDITSSAQVTPASGSAVVTIAPSFIQPFADRVANNVVSGGYVSYENYGDGVYTFELYKWEVDGDEKNDSLEASSDIVVTLGDAGTYTLDTEAQRKNEVTVGDATEAYDEDDAMEILKCFTIIDRKGNSVLNNAGSALNSNKKFAEFFVDYSAPENSDYVYVKEIVFYENVGTNEYVAYVVPVDVSLDRAN